jgi:hypothetical protein
MFLDSEKARLATLFMFERLAKTESRYRTFLKSVVKILQKFCFYKQVPLFRKCQKEIFPSTIDTGQTDFKIMLYLKGQCHQIRMALK